VYCLAADVPRSNPPTRVCGGLGGRLETPRGHISPLQRRVCMLKTQLVGKASLLHSLARMRLAGICVVLGLTATACTTGSSGPTGIGTDATLGPPSESGMAQLGIICSTFYAATGTFVPNAGDPPPANFTGCWPIGAWTFSLTLNADPNTGGGVDTCTTGGH